MELRSRRQFLQGSAALASYGLLSGCGVIPRGAGEARSVRRIGVLAPSQDRRSAATWESFRQRLGDLGHEEGRNLLIEYRWAEEHPDRLPDLAAELVRLDVRVIVANSSAAVGPARWATGKIPIVMCFYGGDPVSDGVVTSLARPGGNITGVTNFATRLAAKRLELLREVVPTIRRVAALWDPSSPGGAPQLAEVQAAGPGLGVAVRALGVPDFGALRALLDAALADTTDALLVLASPLLTANLPAIVDAATANRLPAISVERSHAEAGLLLAYGPDNNDLFRHCAGYVDRILGGASPGELPVTQPEKFDFAINLKTAQALGLSIPQSVLAQATEIIQ